MQLACNVNSHRLENLGLESSGVTRSVSESNPCSLGRAAAAGPCSDAQGAGDLVSDHCQIHFEHLSCPGPAFAYRADETGSNIPKSTRKPVSNRFFGSPCPKKIESRTFSRCNSMPSLKNLIFQDLHQVLAVTIFQHGLGQCFKLLGTDPTRTERDFFGAGHFQTLALFQRGDELAGL